jgi:hypothetical protein
VNSIKIIQIWVSIFIIQLATPNFNSLPTTQTDLDKFLTIFQEIFRVFQGNSVANFEKFQIWTSIYICQLATHVYADIQLSTCYSDRLRQIFDLFSRKFQSFSRKLLSKYQKSQILSTHLYLSMSNACSCQISAHQLLLRRT